MKNLNFVDITFFCFVFCKDTVHWEEVLLLEHHGNNESCQHLFISVALEQELFLLDCDPGLLLYLHLQAF